VDAQTPAALEAQITALSGKITALQATVTVQAAELAAQNVENVNLQKQVTLLQSTATMQAANVAALSKSFTPVQSAVTATQVTDTTQSAAIAAVQRQVNLMASNPALALGPFVTVDFLVENGVKPPNVTFHGVNLHVINGGVSDTGNVIIGDDDGYANYVIDPPSGPPIRGGSYNLVVGPNNAWGDHNYNVVFADGSTIQEGGSNCILGGGGHFIQTSSGSVILGGTGNVLFQGSNNIVGGGTDNVATGQNNVILGGAENDNPFGSQYISEFGPNVPAPTPAPTPAPQSSMRTLN
jgi:hypothetical protein